MARFATTWFAYFVTGTASPAAMTFTEGFARSAGDVIPAGFDAGTITASLLPAKATVGPTVRFASTSFFGFAVSADRKTSAGAPCSIFVSSADEESVEIAIVTPGWDDSYALRAAPRTPLRDAAAYRVTPTVGAAALRATDAPA